MKKTFLILILILAGAAIFVLGNPYYRVFPTNGSLAFTFWLTVFFLFTAVLLQRRPNLSRYAPAAQALFIAAAANFVLTSGVLQLHRGVVDPLRNLALDKVSQFLMIVPLILGLTLFAGGELKSLYIQRGKLRQSLIFGLASFAGFAILALALQWQALLEYGSLGSLVPWMLLWVFANSSMEELWFRGLFLKRYEPLIGRWGAIFVTALIFGASHINATYAFPGGPVVFGLVVFGLGVVGAYSMFNDDGILAPILFHAGYDLVIVVSVLNTL